MNGDMILLALIQIQEKCPDWRELFSRGDGALLAHRIDGSADRMRVMNEAGGSAPGHCIDSSTVFNFDLECKRQKSTSLFLSLLSE